MASQAATTSPSSRSQERIYSAHQLSQALRSGLEAVKDQLQVLTILDGTAASWPGVTQALEDLGFLIDVSAQTSTRMESEVQKAEARVADYRAEAATLKEALSSTNSRSEQHVKDAAQAAKEVRQLTSKLEAAGKEIHQQRQELWTLEKQRADLASEVEKLKQDNEFMEGEITSLRATVTDHMQQLTAVKEELAARKSDVQHLKHSNVEQKAHSAEQRRQLEATSTLLHSTQDQLEHTRREKQHYEEESKRLGEECSRLAAELNKLSVDSARQKDWGDVLQKVEADRLKEEQAAHAKARVDYERANADLERTVARLTAELTSKEQQNFAKAADVTTANKQIGVLNIQLKDLLKQVTSLQTDKDTLTKDRDAAKAEAAQLQAKMQATALQLAQLDKEKALVEGRAKEQSAAERSKLQVAYDETRKEMAVQKALADGWARDVKEIQAKLKAEQAGSAALQQRLDTLSKRNAGEDDKHTDMIKSIATMEQVIRELRAQLNSKDVEMRKAKAENASLLKSSEKQIEKLQRECNEGAAEIQRLRNGDGAGAGALRLPPLATRPQSLQDDLALLRKFMSTSFAERPPLGSISAAARLVGTASPTQAGLSPKHSRHNL